MQHFHLFLCRIFHVEVKAKRFITTIYHNISKRLVGPLDATAPEELKKFIVFFRIVIF